MSSLPKPVKHILCPIDGSEEGCRAAELAACLASALRAKLTYLAVAKPAKVTPEIEAYLNREGLDGMELPQSMPEAEDCLRVAAGIASKCGAPDFLAKIEVGKPFEAISSRARNDGVDLVVLGFSRRLALKNLGRPYLADQVAEKLDMSVLTVP
jgi:nucleotide-binding universal stress UspA family protein